MRFRRVVILLLALAPACLAPSGCARWRTRDLPPLENPIAIPATQCDAVWDAIVDVVDDYFDIQTEQRVRQAGDVMTVGRIDTAPRTGATWLEPWRPDAADKYERTHGTLQTIRRRAVVQVIPAPDVYQIEVTVFKELEDLQRPDYSTAGSATFRTDSSFVRVEEPVGVQPLTKGWIPLGRDAALEQDILQKLWARLGPPGGAPLQLGFGSPSELFVPAETVPQAVTPPAETLPPGLPTQP